MNLLEHAVDSVWRDLLGGTFSVIGRLARLASCRDPQNGRYHHTTLSRELGIETARRALAVTHELVWTNWVSGSLEQQYADVFAYIRDIAASVEHLVDLWLGAHPFALFPPASVSECDRDLFVSNLKLVLVFLVHHHPCGRGHIRTCFHKETNSTVEHLVIGLQEQYGDSNLSLKLVSQKLGLSADHLGRRFKQCTGQTFHAYLRELRMENAATLLTTSGHDIKNIAMMVGYSDRSRFSEHFRITHGLTPLAFRRKRMAQSDGLHDKLGRDQDSAVTEPHVCL